MMESTVNGQAFDSQKVTVIYVLGGPGAGEFLPAKELSAADLYKTLTSGIYPVTTSRIRPILALINYDCTIAGDLLRAEQNRDGSQYKDLIQTCIREGTIVPMEVTIKLLEIAMREELTKRCGPGWTDGKGRFLIDGFPRKMDQALMFDERVCQPSLVLVFEADQEVMIQRILERGKTSGREDDNIESLRKRFQTHEEFARPVINYYERQEKVVKINSNQSIEQCHKEASEAVVKFLV